MVDTECPFKNCVELLISPISFQSDDSVMKMLTKLPVASYTPGTFENCRHYGSDVESQFVDCRRANFASTSPPAPCSLRQVPDRTEGSEAPH